MWAASLFQSPSSGLFDSYLSRKRCKTPVRPCFNPLHRGFFILTRHHDYGTHADRQVSIPFIGAFLFLRSHPPSAMTRRSKFQSPSSGLFYSYKGEVFDLTKKLTKFQSPSSGLFYSYAVSRPNGSTTPPSFNPLHRGFFILTQRRRSR